MHILSPTERQTIAGGSIRCFCPGLLLARIEKPMPLFIPPHHARIFADTVTARELWPA